MNQIEINNYEIMEQKARSAIKLLKGSLEFTLNSIEEIETDFEKNMRINPKERASYLDVYYGMKYLVHDWSNLENPKSSWSQNTEILARLLEVKNYLDYTQEYLKKLNGES